MKKVLAALAAFFAFGVHAQTEKQPVEGFQWKCVPTGRDSMQCAIRNSTDRTAEICMDVVKVCKNEDHHATLCSGELQSGETASKVVYGFRPKVKFLESCMGVEYRDRIVR